MHNKSNEANYFFNRIRDASRLVCLFYSQTKWLFVFTFSTRSIGHLLQLLTFFLPLKILLIASHKTPPSWLSEYVSFYDESVIFTLTGIFAILYVVYLTISAVHHKLFNADLLAQLNHHASDAGKKQTNKYKRAHSKAIENCSDTLIVLLGFLSIFLISAPLALFILVLVCLFFVVTVIMTRPSQMESIDKRAMHRIIDYLSSIFFVFLFVGLLSWMLVVKTDVYATIFALIVGRALIQSSSRLSKSTLRVTL